jgi:perosamine synthetase
MTPKQIICPLRYISPFFLGGADERERRFQKGFSELLNFSEPCLPLGRARTGIYLLVKAHVTPDRKKVLLSPYTIPDVVNMVVFAGGVPVFVDHLQCSTNIDMEQLADSLDDKVACLLLTHYHVNQGTLHTIISICEKKGVAVVEDCAISLGGTIDGVSVGGSSAGAIFSLSSYKFLNYFWGGMLVVQDAIKRRQIKEEVGRWRRFGFADYKGQILRTLKYDLATRPILFDFVTAPVLRRKQRRSTTAQMLHQPRIETETFDQTLQSRPSAGAFSEWNRKLPTVIPHLEHRRRIASVYSAILGDRMVSSEVSQVTISNSCFVNYPVWVGEKDRDAVYKQMILHRFDVGLSLYPNVHEHVKFRDVDGHSHQVARLCRGVISLPTHPRVASGYAEKLAKHLANIL